MNLGKNMNEISINSLLKNIKDDPNCDFAERFLQSYLALSFGAMSKSEIDILVFHLLSRYLGEKSNYEISNLLKISENRVKTLRLNAHLRYGDTNNPNILSNVLKKIKENLQNIESDSKTATITISVENPVEKREILRRLKEMEQSADFSFNDELLKIKLTAVFALLFEDEEIIKHIVQNEIKDKSLQDRLMLKSLTPKQKLGKFLEFANKHSNLTSLAIDMISKILKS